MKTYKYKNMMFFDADSGGGEGGAGGESGAGGDSVAGTGEISRGATAFEPTVKQTTGDRPLPEKKVEKAVESLGSERTETGDTTKPVAPAAFDPAQFAKDLGASLSESIKPMVAPKEQEPKMTPEEAKKFLNVWEPDDAWYKKYDNLETRAEAVNEMRDGLVKQADTLNQLRLQEAISKLREEIAPGLKTVQETAEQQREGRLHTAYPALKQPEYQPLITAVTQDFINKGQTFKSEGELFKALADRVEAVLKVSNPDFKLETVTAKGNGTQQPADRGGRSLPVSTPGGGGGTGRTTGGDKTEPKRGIAIFGGK